jgi:peptide/nickel transport system permease protein
MFLSDHLLANTRIHLQSALGFFWWPGLLIITIALCINFIGDGLRDAFDPRQRRRLTKKDKERAKVQARIAAKND